MDQIIQLQWVKYIFTISLYSDIFAIVSGISGAWSWGNGAGGRLGLGDQRDRYDPCGIPRLRGKSLMMVAASSYHSFALVCYPPMKDGGMVRYTYMYL